MVTHSMGARLLMSALPLLKDILQPAGDPVASSPASPHGRAPACQMATCILISPDADQEDFMACDYEMLRGLCDRITMCVRREGAMGVRSGGSDGRAERRPSVLAKVRRRQGCIRELIATRRRRAPTSPDRRTQVRGRARLGALLRRVLLACTHPRQTPVRV